MQRLLIKDTTPPKSVQSAELKAVQLALQIYSEPCNLYTDSHYVARAVPSLPQAYVLTNDEKLCHLFSSIQQLLRLRQAPILNCQVLYPEAVIL